MKGSGHRRNSLATKNDRPRLARRRQLSSAAEGLMEQYSGKNAPVKNPARQRSRADWIEAPAQAVRGRTLIMAAR
jgi:hypothetical protein